MYSSFGKILKIDNSGVDNTQSPLIKTNFAYTNREYDSESGLYYYRARYYAPDLGRFLTEDPHPGVLREPSSYNSKYSYVLNNPINGTDPEGKILPILIAGLIAGLGNAIFNSGNGQAWYVNFAVGALVGAGGAAAVGWAAGFAGANVGLGMLYGAGAGSVSSWAGQMIINGSTDQSKINWLGVGFGAFAGAIGGGLSAAGKAGFFTTDKMKTTVESIDAVNKGGAQVIIEAPKGEVPLPWLPPMKPLH